MTASEYKAFKGLRKESLRDNMSDIEVILSDLGEISTREIAKKKKDKLPFAVFIVPKKDDGEIQDYKQIFTAIISDRIKQKYR